MLLQGAVMAVLDSEAIEWSHAGAPFLAGIVRLVLRDAVVLGQRSYAA
jgi:hypothetical protein